MTVSFELTLDDLTAVQSARDFRRALRLSWVALVAAGICVPVTLAAGMSAPAAAATALLAGFLAGTVLFWVRPAMRRHHLRRNFRQHPEFRGPVAYEFMPAEVRFATQGSLICFPWSAFTRAHEDREYLYFDVSDAASYFIPKRALDPTDLNALRSLVAAALPAARPDGAGLPRT